MSSHSPEERHPTDYARRAGLYAVEIAHVRAPEMLDDYLRPGLDVAEVPCGAGHHLGNYAKAGSVVHLLDAETSMLKVAVKRAAALNLSYQATQMRIGTDRPPRTYPVVVCPNIALNLLVAQLGFDRAMAGVLALVAPGGKLIAQVLLRHGGGEVDQCGCYDPREPHGVQIAEWRRPAGDGKVVERWRRQHRSFDKITIDFVRQHGSSVVHSTIHLSLLTIRALGATAGSELVEFCRTERGPSAVVMLRVGGGALDSRRML